MFGNVDMGPSRHPLGPEVPAEVSYKHTLSCPHCRAGGRRETCQEWRAIERDFARNAEVR